MPELLLIAIFAVIDHRLIHFISSMMSQGLLAVAFLIAYCGVIITMEYLHRYQDVHAETTRKMAHTLATVSSLLFLLAFDSYGYVLILAIIFFLIFFIGRKYKILRSMEPEGRRTSGTYLLPLSIFLVFVISQQLNNHLYFALPVLIVGISDPLAGYFGFHYRHKTRKIDILGYSFEKTVLGTQVFFSSAFVVSLGVLYFFDFPGIQMFLIALIVAAWAASVEMVSERGYDNITVPIAVIGLLYLVLSF
jgi:phytol kinase